MNHPLFFIKYLFIILITLSAILENHAWSMHLRIHRSSSKQLRTTTIVKRSYGTQFKPSNQAASPAIAMKSPEQSTNSPSTSVSIDHRDNLTVKRLPLLLISRPNQIDSTGKGINSDEGMTNKIKIDSGLQSFFSDYRKHSFTLIKILKEANLNRIAIPSNRILRLTVDDAFFYREIIKLIDTQIDMILQSDLWCSPQLDRTV